MIELTKLRANLNLAASNFADVVEQLLRNKIFNFMGKKQNKSVLKQMKIQNESSYSRQAKRMLLKSAPPETHNVLNRTLDEIVQFFEES